MRSIWNTCLIGAVAAVLTLTTGVQAETRIQGAGATFPAPLYAKWIEAYNKSHPDVKIDYQSIGSGGGISGISQRTVTFGASDAPMTDTQEKAAPAKLVHLPTVAGPAVLIYNIPSIKTLKLSGEVVADVYLKKITKWNDPKITAINAGTDLPNSPIVVVHRSDGSGTSFIFTDYLSKVSPEWLDKVGNATAVQWPVGLGGKGNDGVAAAVKNSPGSIGYVEFAFATKNSLSYATQINKDGKEVTASIDGVIAASTASLTQFPADMKVSIVNASGPDSYPICGYTYLLIYDDLSYLKDKAVATETLNFIKWCETDGQDMAKDLGYAKLPKDAQTKVLEKLKTIKFDGAPLLN